MPSWINHFIVVDKIIDRLNHIDQEYFIIGSIAPDCGKHSAPHGVYEPPTGATHFTSDYAYSKKTDCNYNYVYHTYVENEKDVKKYSFYLAYYIHLFIDQYFANKVFVPIETKYGDFRYHEKLSQTVKKERNNIDYLYLTSHISPSFELFKTFNEFDEDYPSWYQKGQISWQMRNIVKAYENPIPLKMKYQYLTPEMMNDFHSKVYEELLAELKSKGIT